jgi:hypothetical protein
MTVPAEAAGLLRHLYAAAVKRAGKVYQIIEVQSVRPKVLRASTHDIVQVTELFAYYNRLADGLGVKHEP